MASKFQCLLGAIAIVGCVGAQAHAATLSVSGGSSETLSSQFNPGGWANYDGIIAGFSPILVFSGGANTGGLSVDESTKVTFTYMGTDADFTNLAFLTSPLTQMFNNKVSVANTSVAVFDPVGAGVLPFNFTSVNQSNAEAINGGSIASSLMLAIIKISDTRAYAFLEDIAIGGDRDFDDMVIRIDVEANPGTSPVPVPLALPLFAAGLGVVGLLSRRRRPALASA